MRAGGEAASFPHCVQLGHLSCIRLRLGIDFPSEMRSGCSGLYLAEDSVRSERIAGPEWDGRSSLFLANVCPFSVDGYGVAQGESGNLSHPLFL